ncbi:MAG: LysM peptidoglycan-binding domain-containing protein [Microscillaceae bacterium]|nr:LysM peptidoglycan-binding domain-containing protein [Microscillaceae bacterium]
MIYTVRPGDTLFAIAQRYQTSVERLRQINQLTTDQLKPGQVLQVKVEEAALDTIRHRVLAGESLYSIARKYGLSVTELKQLNPLASSNLRIGQELTVKNVATPGSEAIFYHTVPRERLFPALPNDTNSLYRNW